MRLGIDFGTTRTVVAVADRGNYPVVTFESQSGDSAEWFPSLVAAKGDELRFGFDALDVARDPSWATLRSIKRLLAEADTTTSLWLGGRERSVASLTHAFLSALVTALRERSNLSLAGEPLEAVVAAPANAFCNQRFQTLEAFRGAGFSVRALINEPSAAGFEYAHRYARTMSSGREAVIVYDLGGGTFDASLVRMSGAEHDVMRTSGVARLGGDDFDAALAEAMLSASKVAKNAPLASLDDASQKRLLDDCRAVKEALTPTTRRISLDVGSAIGGDAEIVTIAAADYYDACVPLVDSSIAAMAPLLDGENLPADVAGLYVVGGASALPVVGRILKQRFGRRVHRSPYPHAAVAIGLAIFGDDGTPFELRDRFSRNFGVFREEEGGRRATYDPIVTSELPLPGPGEAPVVVRRRYRAAHNLGHYRFFECGAFDDRGSPRGDIAPLTDLYFPFVDTLRSPGVELRAAPVARLTGQGPLVEERYAVDEHGIVNVTIVDLESGFEGKVRIGASA